MADMWLVAVTPDEYNHLHNNYPSQMVYALLTATDSEYSNVLLPMVLTVHEMEWARQSIDHEGIRFALETAQVASWRHKDFREFLENNYRWRHRIPS